MFVRNTGPATDAELIRWPGAVQPASGVEIVPVEGWRPDRYLNPKTGLGVPVLAAAADRSRVFDLFLALLEPLGTCVDVVLESSHFSEAGRPREYRRRNVDRPVLASYFCEFEEMLVEDGCTGVAVMRPGAPMEVQFDEHKALVVYARRRRPFARVLHRAGLRRRNDLKLLSEIRHVHRTTGEFAAMFRDLARRLGMV